MVTGMKKTRILITTFLYLVFVGVIGTQKSTLLSYFDSLLNRPNIEAVEDVSITVSGRLNETSEELRYANILLVDSVLSIVKNYYVDSGRVAEKLIFDAILFSLESSLDLNVKNFANEVVLTLDDQELELAIPFEFGHEQLLNYVFQISRFISNKVELFDSSKRFSNRQERSLVFLLRGLVSTLDAHSNLLSKDSYKELKQGTEGTFGGLGVLVGMRDQLLTVIKPLPRSPAERVGITIKDRILSIDGMDTYGYSLGDLVEHMRGDPGTNVRLSLLREGAMSTQQISVKREVIQVDSVTHKVIDHPYGYLISIYIESFTSRTVDEVKLAISKFKQSYPHHELKGVILDLRSNPGGLLDQAVKVADLFLTHGVIVSTKGRSTEVEMAYNQESAEIKCPVVVLINEESASASEIVAGALQDHDRAIVIGQPSFGKGSVQTIFELPDDRALKLTIARYYTPSGISIQNIGIFPDIWLQPVYNLDKNNNLLGEYRYKNERFLSNRLLNKNDIPKNDKQSTLFKGFYLKEYNNEFESDNSLDREMETAFLIFKQIYKVYKKRVPSFNIRASHWVSLAGKDLTKKVSQWSGEVDKYLSEKLKLEWSNDSKMVNSSEPVFKLNKTVKKALKPGEFVKIPYQVINTSDKPMGRLSIFIRNEHPEFETYEKLLSSIEPGQILNDEIKVHIPTFWKSGKLNFEIGLAAGGRAISSLNKFTSFEITDRQTPEIGISIDLVNEAGGKIAGELEANEHAKIAVYLRNKSKVEAKDLNVRLMNLAGKQLNILDDKEVVGSLAAHQEKIVYFDVSGADAMFTKDIGLGLIVESNDLELPVKKKAAIVAVPSVKRDKNRLIRK
ncbi:MAG: S41 family peptidase [Oligoflexales bacterium]